MQRPSTIRHRTSLFQEATDIVDAEFAADLSLDDIARRVASSRRQLQRAYAEIGHTTFREHLTGVRMERAAEMLAAARPHRPRGRPPRRLPPAGAVREGLPPPPRPVAVGLPDAPPRRSRGRARRRRSGLAGPGRAAPASARPGPDRGARRTGAVRAPGPCCARPEALHRMRRDGARGIAAARPPQPGSDAGRRRHRLGAGDRPRAGHRLVPGGRLHAGRRDRHALGRPRHRLGAGVRPRDDGHHLLGHRLPDAPGRGEPRRAAHPRQHPPRGHLDRDPRPRDPRALRLRLHDADRDREGARQGRPARHRRLRPAVHVDLQLRRAGQEVHVVPALPAGAVRGEVPDPLPRRHPRLLGARLADEDRRGAGHHDLLPREPQARRARRPRHRLRRALRPRARLHAPDRARRPGRPLRRLGPAHDGGRQARALRRSAGRRAGVRRPGQAALRGREHPDRRHRLRRLPHARRGRARAVRPGRTSARSSRA